MSSQSSSWPLRVGVWYIDPSANEFVQEGNAIRVEPKVMQVLLALAEHPGEAVSRDDLLEWVWSDVVVSEDALSTTISKLRRALDDDARNPQYVETIPKTGYRLIAPVVLTEPKSSPAVVPHPAWPTGHPSWVLILSAVSAVLILLLVTWLVRRVPASSVPTLRPLTTATGSEQYPSLSPDGQRVAYAARARDTDHYDLYVQLVEVGNPLRLTDDAHDDLHPEWAPDGQSLAFLRCEGFQCKVYTVSGLGGAPRRRAEATVGRYGLAWTQDGQNVIVLVRADSTAPYRLHILNLETGSMRPLTDPPLGAVGDVNPILAPNDETLAFVRYQNGGPILYRMSFPDGTPVRLVTKEGPINGIAWTPDGVLLVSAAWEGTLGLWRVSEDAPPQRITGSVPAIPGALAAADSWLVVEDWIAEINLWTTEQDEQNWQPLRPAITSTAIDWQPALSPDGTRVAFVSNRSGTRELWVVPRDGSQTLRLTYFGGERVDAPSWSPDGQRLVFEVQQQGYNRLYTITAEGGNPKPLTNTGAYDHTPRFSHDGRWIYFGSDRSGGAEIWKVSANGGEPMPVTTQGGYVAAESADGILYFTRIHQSGLWMRPVEGGQEERVLETLSPLDWGNWVVTNKCLYYLDRTSEQTRLMRLDLQTRTKEFLFEVNDIPTRVVALSATPDGRTIIFARTDRSESNLVLIESLQEL